MKSALEILRATIPQSGVHLDTGCELHTLRQARDEAIDALSWRPVTETEPGIEERCLFVVQGYVHLGHRMSENLWMGHYGVYRHVTTHWMPLPPAPEEKT